MRALLIASFVVGLALTAAIPLIMDATYKATRLRDDRGSEEYFARNEIGHAAQACGPTLLLCGGLGGWWVYRQKGAWRRQRASLVVLCCICFSALAMGGRGLAATIWIGHIYASPGAAGGGNWIPFALYPWARKVMWVVLYAVVAVIALRSRRFLLIKESGHCHECGYDLTGNTSGVCPECGSVTRVLRKGESDRGS
jgi:hypothetical protein